MTAKLIIPREPANRDIDEAVDHYLNDAGEAVALRFIDSLEQAYRHITRHPVSGSSRYAHELDLPGLKFWPVKRFPFLVFYMDCDNHIDVWRVLHVERDIPAWMREPDAS